MNKFEFENLSGRSVTEEQYKAIEILYMSSDLGKAEFVKSMKPMLKSIPQPKKEKDIKRMLVRYHSGFIKTPNGCYFHIKYIIKPLEDKDFEQLIKDGKSLSLSTWFDFNFEDCIDENKNRLS